MKPVKVWGDALQQGAFCAQKQEKNEEASSVGELSNTSGSVLADASELTYLERKALAAQGIWGRVRETESGCWEWQGAKNEQGYGGVRVHKKYHSAHRLILELFDGPLKLGEAACHACNNPACINPKHLTRGTYGDNARDASECRFSGKGRPRSPDLTPEQVQEVRELYTIKGWSAARIGQHFRLHQSHIFTHLDGLKRALMRDADPVALNARRLYSLGGWTKKDLAQHLGLSIPRLTYMVRGILRPDRKPLAPRRRPA